MTPKSGKNLPYDDAFGEPLDGRDSQPMESGDQDYPETLDASDPLREEPDELTERGMHIELDSELGYDETQEGVRTQDSEDFDDDEMDD